MKAFYHFQDLVGSYMSYFYSGGKSLSSLCILGAWQWQKETGFITNLQKCIKHEPYIECCLPLKALQAFNILSNVWICESSSSLNYGLNRYIFPLPLLASTVLLPADPVTQVSHSPQAEIICFLMQIASEDQQEPSATSQRLHDFLTSSHHIDILSSQIITRRWVQ